MKRKATKTSAFSKLKAGLEDAIAYHQGARHAALKLLAVAKRHPEALLARQA